MLRALAKQEPSKSLLISPLGFEVTFSFLLAGTTGKTQETIRQWLCENGQAIEPYLEALKSYVADLGNLPKDTKITFSNFFGYNEDYPVQESYQDLVKTLWDTEMTPLPPSNSGVFSIINNLHFKANWEKEFRQHPFITDDFIKEDGSTEEQIFMIQEHDHEHKDRPLRHVGYLTWTPFARLLLRKTIPWEIQFPRATLKSEGSFSRVSIGFPASLLRAVRKGEIYPSNNVQDLGFASGGIGC